jgi:hypothetical protein
MASASLQTAHLKIVCIAGDGTTDIIGLRRPARTVEISLANQVGLLIVNLDLNKADDFITAWS